MFKLKNILIKIIYIFLFLPFISYSVEKKYDVVAIGKAMVDLIENVSEEELKQIMPAGFNKSDSNRIDEKTADEIQAKMHDITVISGGSEANIVADIGSLGGNAAFNAIAADDELGNLFKKGLEKENVKFLSPFTQDKSARTARCFTFITPDKDRTFAVSASITSEISDWYIDYEAIKESKVFYTDASNLSHGGAQSKVTNKAMDVAIANGTIIAFSLNNNHYVEKYRDEIISLLPKVSIFISSEKEAKNLFKVSNIDEALNRYLKYVKVAVITQGKKGAVIATKDSKFTVKSVADDRKIIDLNGAGDGFTAGFLYGYTHNYTLKDAATLGSKTAAEIIYQVGARPQENLKDKILF